LPFLALFAARPAAAEDIMSAIRAERWPAAEQAASALADPVAGKLVTWFRLLAPGAATLSEITAFMADSPDWPLQSALARRRDAALAAEPNDATAATECDRPRPFVVASAAALARCAEAYAQLNRAADAAAMARRAWIAGPADANWELHFMQRWGSAITREDQWARFDRLAWTDTVSARRQAARLEAPDRPRAEARLALRGDDPNGAALVAALPEAQRHDPGLVLELARWLRRAGQDDDALALWKGEASAAERTAPPERRAAFWDERNRLARQRLRIGDNEGAYALAADDALSGGESLLDAQFLAGFIALRKLNAPAMALPHFRALAAASQATITQARAHFWLARTAAAQGDDKAARAEYQQAAAYPSTFYGQAAEQALGEVPAARIAAQPDPAADGERALEFAGRELARGAAWLVSWGEPGRAESFLLRLNDVTPDAADRTLAARLAAGLGMPDVAITIARRAGRDGITLLQAGWPAPLAVPADVGIERALALGIIRQESSFDTSTVSPAGARGLMQLMPDTARLMAHDLGLRVSIPALTGDAQYNIRLGCTYMRQLLDQFRGSIPLAVAAYNAGPSRVQDWLVGYGDPRTDATGMIDWIELIPFSETRNYVQRVIENLVVYRAESGETGPVLAQAHLPAAAASRP
jgi:soluble lytic murein transglycosylase